MTDLLHNCVAALEALPERSTELDVVLAFARDHMLMLDSFRVVPVPVPGHLKITCDGYPGDEPEELYIPRSTAERIHAALGAALKEDQ